MEGALPVAVPQGEAPEVEVELVHRPPGYRHPVWSASFYSV